MNIIHLAGHLGADAETRFTQEGMKVTTFRMATSYSKDETQWWKITLWGDKFDKQIPYLLKGSAIYIVGKMKVLKLFTAKDGTQKCIPEVTADSIQWNPFGNKKADEENQMKQETASKTDASFHDLPF